jgi:hypothetical protein
MTPRAMRFLADVDQPPRSRARGLLFGAVVALPVAAILVGWLIPTAIGSILGGAEQLDARLRATDAYLGTLCSERLEPGRDEDLCGCVLAMEFPSMDCRAPFNLWALDRQRETCAQPDVRATALSYCACVEAVATAVDAAADAGDRRLAAQAYENCADLEDAAPLP